MLGHRRQAGGQAGLGPGRRCSWRRHRCLAIRSQHRAQRPGCLAAASEVSISTSLPLACAHVHVHASREPAIVSIEHCFYCIYLSAWCDLGCQTSCVIPCMHAFIFRAVHAAHAPHLTAAGGGGGGGAGSATCTRAAVNKCTQLISSTTRYVPEMHACIRTGTCMRPGRANRQRRAFRCIRIQVHSGACASDCHGPRRLSVRHFK